MSWPKKSDKKPHKDSSVFRDSNVKGYVQVHISYLLEELEWLKNNTKLTLGTNKNPNVEMLDHLLTWMAQRKKPLWMIFTDERKWKQWVTLKKDHWVVNHNIREELMKKGML